MIKGKETILKTALLYTGGDNTGAEYFHAMKSGGRTPDLVIEIGRIPEGQFAREEIRTGGQWRPPEIPPERIDAKFENLTTPELWSLLTEQTVDLAIQGGIGILKRSMIEVPQMGILNVHPGRLPAYRGNSCPEWAVFNDEEIHLTAHMIDAGIDTGPVVVSRVYRIAPEWSYETFRANIYAQCGEVLTIALRLLEEAGDHWPGILHPQPESGAQYRPPIPEGAKARVRAAFPNWTPKHRFPELGGGVPLPTRNSAGSE